MIHAFALEPKLVASWGKITEFRFIHDKFGLGTPRAMLELPAFSKWKRDVYEEAQKLGLSDEDMTRIAEIFRLLGEHKCRRTDSVYDGLRAWIENAEREYDRKSFAAILATANPRGHQAVLVADQLGPDEPRWSCSVGASPARTPQALSSALSAMLVNCRVLHLVDPHFGPENARHRKVLEALLGVLSDHEMIPELVRVHCQAKSLLTFFESEATKMAARLPTGITVEFARWKQRDGGDLLHNRYVLTDLGGVMLGAGLDTGAPGETDDLVLLAHGQYVLRWAQYVEANGAFLLVDAPAPVRGMLKSRVPQGR